LTETSAYLKKVCEKVVDQIWFQLDTASLTANDGCEPTVICRGEDLEDDFIGCECRSVCPRGEFFITLVLMLIPIICLCRGIVAPNVGDEKFSRIVFLIVGKT
jgi:hypothetical protein